MEPFHQRQLRYRERWFCYLDLLGFTALVNDSSVDYVIPLYEEVLAEIERHAAPKSGFGISYSWFSDTFIIFSKGGTDEEFSLVEQAGRLFFQRLILREIPVRGAITFGKLYSQIERNIFVGEALIDAYKYGEKQNWLGFILTPRVYQKFINTPLDLRNRQHYRRVEARGVITHQNPHDVFAFAFNNGLVNGQNPFLPAIRSMRNKAGPSFEDKYINTEQFIQQFNDGPNARASA